MKRYPVSDDVAKQIDLFIKTLECSSTKNRRTYLSGPMTTGRRYLELITTTQTTPSLIKDICMRENLRLLDTHAQYQRQLNKDETIINPGRLHLPNFSTNEYMHLWLRIITNHVHTVVALPDWEYSVGASIEVGVALDKGICVYDTEGHAITTSRAREMILAAMTKYTGDRATSSFVDEWFNAMTTVLSERYHTTIPYEWKTDVLAKWN